MKEKILDKVREVCGLKIPKDLPLPVRYDGMMYYWGKDNEMVADFDSGVNDGEGFRIRGWGRIQDEESQDECARYIEKAINAYSEPQLNHLLHCLEKNKAEMRLSLRWDSLVFNENGDNEVLYDLTKSVPENLDNPELCNLLEELLNIKWI